MICSDGNRLYRVMQNLIDNALKYALEGTRIYIRENIYLKSGTGRTDIQSGLHGSAIKSGFKENNAGTEESAEECNRTAGSTKRSAGTESGWQQQGKAGCRTQYYEYCKIRD